MIGLAEAINEFKTNSSIKMFKIAEIWESKEYFAINCGDDNDDGDLCDLIDKRTGKIVMEDIDEGGPATIIDKSLWESYV